MVKLSILVVDDEAALRDLLSGFLQDEGHRVETADTVAQARYRLAKHPYDAVVCDVRLPDGDGIELLRETRRAGNDVLFIMMTAFGSVELVVESLRADAFDFITKPVRRQELTHRLAQAGSMLKLRAENSALRAAAKSGAGDLYRFKSPSMAVLTRLVGKVAPTGNTVLISGESGTGKGIVARQIHEDSAYSAGPFVVVNCGAIPDNLIESELFGHVKGSFTGADRQRKGLFLQADHGTLFLDEIGELPLTVQAKLLHALEDKAIRPVGGESSRLIDTRIIAATNRDLQLMVSDGHFREDLFFRIATFRLELPPLRERLEDLPHLIDHVLDRIAGDIETRRAVVALDSDARQALLSYTWPGNVRELENAINRAYIVADGEQITIADLPPEITSAFDLGEHSAANMAPAGHSLRERVRRYEITLIEEALLETGGDRKLAAARLGIGLSSLYRKLEDM